MEISKKEFKAFEDVRKSGVTNMFMISDVEDLSGVDRDKIKYIMKNYDELNKKWPEIREQVLPSGDEIC